MLLKRFGDTVYEAGCDEAGRGCLAGPVVAAAVVLPENFENAVLNDSKQLSESKREMLREIIVKEALAWAVAFIDNYEIDQINILNASIKAMHKAVEQLSVRPDFLIIDGNRFKTFENISHACIVKGDAKYMSIAAASVLAKTFRDDYMNKIHDEHPEYLWKKNKGYPTQEHRDAIQLNGITPYHRKTFQLLKKQLKLDF